MVSRVTSLKFTTLAGYIQLWLAYQESIHSAKLFYVQQKFKIHKTKLHA